MKRRMLALLLCLVLCAGTVMPVFAAESAAPNAEAIPVTDENEIAALEAALNRDNSAAQTLEAAMSPLVPETQKSTRAAYYNQLLPHLTTIGQGAVTGTTMTLRYTLYSFGASNQKCNSWIYYGTADDGECVATADNWYSTSIGTQNWTLSWYTGSNIAGSYTAYSFTTYYYAGSWHIKDTTIMKTPIFLSNTAMPIKSITFYDNDIKSAVTNVTLTLGADDSYWVESDPSLTTDDKGFELTCSDSSVLKVENANGSVDVEAVGPGTATITAQCGAHKAYLTVTVPHTCQYTSKTYAPTCTEAGYIKYTCTICGKSYTESTGAPALGHQFDGETCVRCGAPTWCPDAKTCPSAKYSDINTSYWYHKGVDYAIANGLMNGTGSGKFEPNAPMTRAMLVTVLRRDNGSTSKYPNNYSDVLNNVWYTDAIAWASYYGIVNGTGDGKFEPDANVTREQLATILYRYAKKAGVDNTARTDLSAFPDSESVSPWAAEAMQWAVAEGIITGSEEHGKVYLQPQGNATRAQVATILMRFIDKKA